MNHIKVDFIIPTSDKKLERVKTCLQSIKDQIGPFQKEIIIEEGFGFTENVNRGIRKGKNPFIALINDDVILDKNWLKEAYKTIYIEPLYAGTATKVLSSDGMFIDSCGMDFYIQGKAIKRGNRELANLNNYKQVAEVFGIPCSVALFKRKMIEEIGLFDNKFIAYEEDVDLSIRLRLLGYKIIFTPYAVSYHQMCATSRHLGNFKAKMDTLNWIYIVYKNYSLKMLLNNISKIILERLKNIKGLIEATIKASGWKSLWFIPISFFTICLTLFINLPSIISDRRKIQKNRKIGDNELLKWIKT